MKITFLGTGTSVGVPAIGCDCGVCTSEDPRNKRSRASILVEAGDTHVVVDTGPDFRMQALTHKIQRVDAVVFTHSHADHILGFDDIRRFNTMQDSVIPAYGSPETIADMKRIFDYIGKDALPGVHRPRVEFMEIDSTFRIGDAVVEPVEVPHERKRTYGYRFECDGCTLGYFPDCHSMSDELIPRLKGIDVMVLDALRHKPHTTHLDVARSVEVLRQIGAGVSFLTHMGHDLDHEETERGLPAGFLVAYDGLTREW